jgi:REP element-mobilizing transposase RayT
MVLNEIGRIVAEEWQNLPAHYPHILLDEFVVMPNHFHGILFLDPPASRGTEDTASRVPTRRFGVASSGTVSAIVGNFKSGATRRIRAHVGRLVVVWQARFHDHIIRDHQDFINHCNYIARNPMNWADDELHPDR